MDLLKFAHTALSGAAATLAASRERRAARRRRAVRPRTALLAGQRLGVTGAPRRGLPATLVVSGGGMKAFYLLGALSKLHDDGTLCEVSRFAGTSAGALIATVLSLGYSPRDMLTHALWMPSMNRQRPRTVLELMGVVMNSARDTFEDIIGLLGGLIERRGLPRDATFAELSRATGGRELLVVATRVSSTRSVSAAYFSTRATPDASVLRAVRASCAVPLVVDPVVTSNGDTFFDGCLVDNFPVDAALDTWLDGRPTLAVGIQKGRLLRHVEAVSYVLVPTSEKYGEGLMSSTAERLEMFVHGRACLGRRERRASC